MLFLLLFNLCFATSQPISNLPLGSAATTGAGDSFPYVQASNNTTRRLTVWDLVNIPGFATTYATVNNPTFTGTVTAPLFVGDVTGTASGNTTITPVNHSLVLSSGSNILNTLAPDASTSKALISGGSSADPSWGVLGFLGGGTGQTTQQASMDALAGATTSGQYLRGNGSNVVMSAIQAADVPTLNQNTTGTASNITGSSNSTLTTLGSLSLPGSQVTGNISGNSANVTGTVAIANGGTNNASLGVVAGGTIYSDGSKLVNAGAGTSGQFLKSNGASAPAWNTLTPTDAGLSNVTNDSQLKRSSNDFNTFTEKTVPAANDVFIMEDSAASGAKKYIKYSNVNQAATFSGVSYYGTTSTVTNAGPTVIKYNTLSYDPNTDYNTSTGLFTAPSTGKYAVGAQYKVTLNSTANSDVSIYIYKNGSPYRAANQFSFTTGVNGWYQPKINDIISLTAGDTVGIYDDQQIVAGTFSITNSNETFFYIYKIGN